MNGGRHGCERCIQCAPLSKPPRLGIDGSQDYVVSPGFVVFISRGTIHAIWNATDSPGKAISIFTPGGMESYFKEMAAIFQERMPPDRSKLAAVSAKYGIANHMEWVTELSAKYGVRLG
jgi:hypothetical protein